MREVVLLESRRRRVRPSPGSAVVSVALHGGLILFAVVATAEGSRAVRERLDESRIHFAPPRPSQPAAAPASDRPTARRPLADALTLPRPNAASSFQVPDVLPSVDAPLTDPGLRAELSELGTSGVAVGIPGLGSGVADGVYERHQVDEPAAAISNQPGPRYPVNLMRSGVEGRVRVRFVVTADGRAEGSVAVLAATRPEFEASVRAFLGSARFRPARVGGKPVAQLVEQEFVFKLRR